MFANLLPGLREIRTPLAAGYLWLVVFYAWWGNDLVGSHGPLGDLVQQFHQAGGFLGHSAELAAISFVAYLVGAVWEGAASASARIFWLLLRMERGKRDLMLPWISSPAAYTLRRLVEDAVRGWTGSHPDEPRPDDASIDWNGYFDDCLAEVGRLPLRFAVEESKLWEMWDRLDSERQFRMTIAGPVTALAVTLGFRVHWVWGFGVLAGLLLVLLGQRKGFEATSVLIQAVRSGIPSAALPTLTALAGAGRLRTVTEDGDAPAGWARYRAFWRDEFLRTPWTPTAGSEESATR